MFTSNDIALIKEIISNQFEYYNVYYINKRTFSSKTKKRKIIAPNEVYKTLQQKLLDLFMSLQLFPISKYSAGWKKGSSPQKCSKLHVNQNTLVDIDIVDYFGNIRFSHIEDLFKDKDNIIDGLSNEEIALFITVPINNNTNKRFLPQGFKTSPYIANAVRYTIDMAIANLCTLYKWKYNTYGDNLFISGDFIPYDIFNTVNNILKCKNFKLNPRKCKLMTKGMRHEILSLTVNEKVSIPKDYYSSLLDQILSDDTENTEQSPSIKGKINVFNSADNKRNYNFLNKIVKLKNVKENI